MTLPTTAPVCVPAVLPVTLPVTLPTTAPVCVPTVLPVTLPVTLPVIVPDAVTFVKLGDDTGLTSQVVPLHIQVSVPTVNVSFKDGLFGKFIAIMLSYYRYLVYIALISLIVITPAITP